MKRTLIYLSAGMLILMMVLMGCNKNSKTDDSESITEPTVTNSQQRETIEEKPIEEAVKTIKEEKKEFELQIIASQNLRKTLKEKKKYEKYGFEVKMVKKMIGKKLYYRIRLKNLYTLSNAQEIAQMLEKEFNLKQKIWIQKIR